jgi:hypothetical protein
MLAMRASSHTTRSMKPNHVIVLKNWNSRKQIAETVAQVGEPRTITEALETSERLNKVEGFTFGGFGQYYATERVEVAK